MRTIVQFIGRQIFFRWVIASLSMTHMKDGEEYVANIFHYLMNVKRASLSTFPVTSSIIAMRNISISKNVFTNINSVMDF